MDIERLKDKYIDGFQKGDYIVVQEKIDGANFSFGYDETTDGIKSCSRNRELGLGNNLRGAYEWSQQLDKTKVKKVLGNNLIIFSEWLIPHSVPYPQNRYKNVYCYDVYDDLNKIYLPQSEVKRIVQELDLIYIPIFYEGEFTSWEELKQFIGQTKLDGEYGEGIVVKNMTRLNDPNNRLPFYTKLVCEKFIETKGHDGVKVIDTDKLAEKAKLQKLVESIVTEARVIKLLHKMVDENIIPEDWDEKHMGIIAKNMGKNVYYDCVKEEEEIVGIVGEDFGRISNFIAMKIVKSELNKR